MNQFIQNNKLYVVAVVIPAVAMIASLFYFGNFKTIALDELQMTEIAPTQENTAVVPAVTLWDKEKDKEDVKLMSILISLQKEDPTAVPDMDKLYNLNQINEVTVELAKNFRKFMKMDKLFLFPKVEEQKEEIVLPEVTGIMYGRAIIQGKMMGVGDTILDGKAKIIEIKGDTVTFEVEGKKIPKSLKK